MRIERKVLTEVDIIGIPEFLVNLV